MPEVTYITTSQVADLAKVDSSAVRMWVKKRKLKPAIKTPGGHYRFRLSDVEELLSAEPAERTAWPT